MGGGGEVGCGRADGAVEGVYGDGGRGGGGVGRGAGGEGGGRAG